MCYKILDYREYFMTFTFKMIHPRKFKFFKAAAIKVVAFKVVATKTQT